MSATLPCGAVDGALAVELPRTMIAAISNVTTANRAAITTASAHTPRRCRSGGDGSRPAVVRPAGRPIFAARRSSRALVRIGPSTTTMAARIMSSSCTPRPTDWAHVRHSSPKISSRLNGPRRRKRNISAGAAPHSTHLPVSGSRSAARTVERGGPAVRGAPGGRPGTVRGGAVGLLAGRPAGAFGALFVAVADCPAARRRVSAADARRSGSHKVSCASFNSAVRASSRCFASGVASG